MASQVKFKRKTRSTKNQIAEVYLIEAIGLFRYKMGWAFSAEDRCYKLKRAQPPVNYQILEVFSCYNAEGIETELHRKYAAYKVELEHSEEWFELPTHVLQEVREIYKGYQQQWSERGETSAANNKGGMEVIGALFERLAKIGRGTIIERIVEGLDRKVFESKKITLWSIANLVFEVIGRTVLCSIAAVFQHSPDKKNRYRQKKRKAFAGISYYHRRKRQSGFYRIGAAAIALAVAALITAMIL